MNPLAGWSLARRLAAGAGLVLILAAAILWYGHARYRAAVRATDAKWAEAGRRLEARAAESAGRADAAARQRVGQFNQRVAQERERIDAAERNGGSPFDVLFGN